MKFATLFQRSLAFLIDIILIILAVMMLSIPIRYAPSAIQLLITIAVFPIIFLYFILFEHLAGQTIGKKIMKIAVITQHGKKPAIKQAIIRNILRIIDGLPFFYILGIILIILTKQKQRLGDMIAHTIVIIKE